MVKDNMGVFVKKPEGGRQSEDLIVQRIILKKAFFKLPKEYQVILGLLNHGLTQQNIAEILGISRTSVGSAKKRALILLKNALPDWSN